MKKKGFTIIEMIVVTGIISILAVLMSVMIVNSVKSYRVKNQSVVMEERAATVMREFEQNIRAATKIDTVSANEIVYYRFVDASATSPKKVRYFLTGGQFKVGVTDPVGIEPNISYPSGNEKIELVVGDVVNTGTIFKYYNGLNAEVTNYANIPAITMVQLTIELDSDPSKSPAKVSETTTVSLRNMKRNL